MRLPAHIARTAFLFGAFGLAGPLLRWIFWPPSLSQMRSSEREDFVSSLVALLWPTQIIAMIDPNNERVGVAIGAVLANVMWLAGFGCIVSLAGTPQRVALLYGGWTLLLAWASRYMIGSPFSGTNLAPFLAALATYALPFLIFAAVLRHSPTVSRYPPTR